MKLILATFALFISAQAFAHDGPHPVGPSVKNGQLDVLFVVDDSASFQQGRERVAQAISLSAAAMKSLALDTHFAITSLSRGGRSTGEIFSNQDPELSSKLSAAIRSENVKANPGAAFIDSAYFAFNAPIFQQENADVVRAGADLAVIFIVGHADQSGVYPFGLYNRLLDLKQGHADEVHMIALASGGQLGETLGQLMALTQGALLSVDDVSLAAAFSGALQAIH
jgi:hypothetical protein